MGGQKPKLTPRQARIAQDMYDELGSAGKRVYTVQRIADEFGVSRPTIYRHIEHAAETV
ncbi:MAG: helix-turn-helix domain-containing protein [Patulibacter sp.]